MTRLTKIVPRTVFAPNSSPNGMPTFHTRDSRHTARPLRGTRARRGGGVALWFLIVSPLFIAALVMVVDLGHLWLSRIELENAVAAASLAGARSVWDAAQDSDVPGSSEKRAAARQVAARFLGANSVAGTSLQLHPDGATPPPEDRARLVERIILLGDVDLGTHTFHLSPSEIENRGCHVKAVVAIDSLCLGIEGFYSLEAAATAVNEGSDVNVRLTRIEQFD